MRVKLVVGIRKVQRRKMQRNCDSRDFQSMAKNPFVQRSCCFWCWFSLPLSSSSWVSVLYVMEDKETILPSCEEEIVVVAEFHTLNRLAMCLDLVNLVKGKL